MLAPGRYFAPEEFACKPFTRADGTLAHAAAYPEEWTDRWTRLLALCERIREKWTRPLVVVCGYRTEEYNEHLIARDEVLGSHQVASSSQHVTGNAADLRPETTRDVSALYGLVDTMYRIGQLKDEAGVQLLGGIGIYPRSGWVHVDTHVADDGHLRRWSGF